MKNKDRPKKVYTGGTFDLFHYGHVRLLESIKYKVPNCQVVVAVNSDKFCESYKRKPVLEELERLEVVRSCKNVDHAFIVENWKSQNQYIHSVNPDYIAIGSDWKNQNYLKQLNITNKDLTKLSCKMLL